MPAKLIRANDNRNEAILGGDAPAELIYFNLLKLAAGGAHSYRLAGFETAIGSCDISVGGVKLDAVGRRASVWSGAADSIYAGPDAEVKIVALGDCEIAIAGGRWDGPMAPFRITPDEVDMLDVGSNETKSRPAHIPYPRQQAGRPARDSCW